MKVKLKLCTKLETMYKKKRSFLGIFAIKLKYNKNEKNNFIYLFAT